MSPENGNAVPLPEILNEDLAFIHALRSRKVPFTWFLLVLNFLIFILMELAGGTMNPATLMAFGVKSNAAIDSGEVWRFVTPVFIHIGLLHLTLNSYALWIVGQQVERLYGSARFITMYVIMGIAGVLGSYLYSPEALSAGASGAIFGLFGVLLLFGVRHRRSVPAFLRRAIGAGILPVILINLVIGFAIPAIDNAAHIGGLLAGAALGALFGIQQPGSRTPALFKASQVLALALIMMGFQQVAIHYDGPRPSLSNLARGWDPRNWGRPATSQFIDAVNGAEETFRASRLAVQSGEAAGNAAGLSEALAGSIDRLSAAPSLSEEADRLLEEMKEVLQRQYALIQDIGRAGRVGREHERRLEENAGLYRETYGRLIEWVRTDGGRYGLMIENDEDGEPEGP